MKFWVKVNADGAYQEQLFVSATNCAELKEQLRSLLKKEVKSMSIVDFSTQVVEQVRNGVDFVSVWVEFGSPITLPHSNLDLGVQQADSCSTRLPGTPSSGSNDGDGAMELESDRFGAVGGEESRDTAAPVKRRASRLSKVAIALACEPPSTAASAASVLGQPLWVADGTASLEVGGSANLSRSSFLADGPGAFMESSFSGDMGNLDEPQERHSFTTMNPSLAMNLWTSSGHGQTGAGNGGGGRGSLKSSQAPRTTGDVLGSTATRSLNLSDLLRGRGGNGASGSSIAGAPLQTSLSPSATPRLRPLGESCSSIGDISGRSFHLERDAEALLSGTVPEFSNLFTRRRATQKHVAFDPQQMKRICLTRSDLSALLNPELSSVVRNVACDCFVRVRVGSSFSVHQIVAIGDDAESVTLDWIHYVEQRLLDSISNVLPTVQEILTWAHKMQAAERSVVKLGFIEAKAGDVSSALRTARGLTAATTSKSPADGEDLIRPDKSPGPTSTTTPRRGCHPVESANSKSTVRRSQHEVETDSCTPVPVAEALGEGPEPQSEPALLESSQEHSRRSSAAKALKSTTNPSLSQAGGVGRSAPRHRAPSDVAGGGSVVLETADPIPSAGDGESTGLVDARPLEVAACVTPGRVRRRSMLAARSPPSACEGLLAATTPLGKPVASITTCSSSAYPAAATPQLPQDDGGNQEAQSSVCARMPEKVVLSGVPCGHVGLKGNDRLLHPTITLIEHPESDTCSVSLFGTRRSNATAKKSRRSDFAGCLLTLSADDLQQSVTSDRDVTEKGYEVLCAPQKWNATFVALSLARPAKKDRPVGDGNGAGAAAAQEFILVSGRDVTALYNPTCRVNLPLPAWAGTAESAVIVCPQLCVVGDTMHAFYLVKYPCPGVPVDYRRASRPPSRHSSSLDGTRSTVVVRDDVANPASLGEARGDSVENGDTVDARGGSEAADREPINKLGARGMSKELHQLKNGPRGIDSAEDPRGSSTSPASEIIYGLAHASSRDSKLKVWTLRTCDAPLRTSVGKHQPVFSVSDARFPRHASNRASAHCTPMRLSMGGPLGGDAADPSAGAQDSRASLSSGSGPWGERGIEIPGKARPDDLGVVDTSTFTCNTKQLAVDDGAHTSSGFFSWRTASQSSHDHAIVLLWYAPEKPSEKCLTTSLLSLPSHALVSPARSSPTESDDDQSELGPQGDTGRASLHATLCNMAASLPLSATHPRPSMSTLTLNSNDPCGASRKGAAPPAALARSASISDVSTGMPPSPIPPCAAHLPLQLQTGHQQQPLGGNLDVECLLGIESDGRQQQVARGTPSYVTGFLFGDDPRSSRLSSILGVSAERSRVEHDTAAELGEASDGDDGKEGTDETNDDSTNSCSSMGGSSASSDQLEDDQKHTPRWHSGRAAAGGAGRPKGFSTTATAVELLKPRRKLQKPPSVAHADRFADATSFSTSQLIDDNTWPSVMWRKTVCTADPAFAEIATKALRTAVSVSFFQRRDSSFVGIISESRRGNVSVSVIPLLSES